MADHSKQVSDLYHAALELPPEQRADFLKDACGDYDGLRQEIESLLQYDAASAGFLERPAAPAAVGTVGAIPSSMVNRQIGAYRMVALLGVGGMGEVYRAHDTKLGRDVAIKILPAHFTDEPERRARFAREARLLATLNHPHIGAIYGIEEADGVTALVLELVEGPTLSDRLERGRMQIREALAIARQIAEALAAAHEKGIVHRDLKPANIVLQRSASGEETRAKVLDFGLAKPIVVNHAGEVTRGVSLSGPGTADGRILGTPAYMSPEQARGLAVDKRTDIWAFGCVLFEMLTARRPFDGETLTDTLASVLEREPDWAALPAETPASIRRLLERCLRKDTRQRLHDMADVLIEIDDAIGAAAHSSTTGGQAHRTVRQPVKWIAAAFLAGGVVTAGYFAFIGRSRAQEADPIELAMVAPAGTNFPATGSSLSLPSLSLPPFALSPDGRAMALLAISGGSSPTLWIRRLGGGARQLPGTEGAVSPFWSPDSREIGFFADGKLKRIAVAGGPAVEICDAAGGLSSGGGAWSSDNVILFTDRGALQKVSSSGGPSTPVTTLREGERRHALPSFLPDGQSFLFVGLLGDGQTQLEIGSLTSAESHPVGSIRSQAIYAAGYLVFLSEGGLMAQRFDTRTRQLTGEPAPLFEDAATATILRGAGRAPVAAVLSVSEGGVLAYRIQQPPESQLTWFSRNGSRQGTVGEPGIYSNLSLSPDDRQVAVSRWIRDNFDIWVIDLARGGDMRKLTSDPNGEFDPTWSRPRGDELIFQSNRTQGRFSLWRRPSNGSGRDALVAEDPQHNYTTPDWSPDGKFVISSGAGDLWLHTLGTGTPPTPFLATQYEEVGAVFSPDGRFITYSSDHTGRREVYVRPFPAKEPEYKVSLHGGSHPRWRSDGEITFLALDATMMSARLLPGNDFHAIEPQPLFPTGLPPAFIRQNRKPYDVTIDGKRFLLPVVRDTRVDPITVVTNWTARLRQ